MNNMGDEARQCVEFCCTCSRAVLVMRRLPSNDDTEASWHHMVTSLLSTLEAWREEGGRKEAS